MKRKKKWWKCLALLLISALLLDMSFSADAFAESQDTDSSVSIYLEGDTVVAFFDYSAVPSGLFVYAMLQVSDTENGAYKDTTAALFSVSQTSANTMKYTPKEGGTKYYRIEFQCVDMNTLQYKYEYSDPVAITLPETKPDDNNANNSSNSSNNNNSNDSNSSNDNDTDDYENSSDDDSDVPSGSQTTKKKKIKINSVTAKQGSKKITGSVSVSKATVKIKVGSKKYKKAKVTGKKFSLKTSALKKGTKITVKASKKKYQTATKTVKVKGSSSSANPSDTPSSTPSVGNRTCTACYGTGRCNYCKGARLCPTCNGKGGRSVPTYGQGGSGWVTCTACHGSKMCKRCGGSGRCGTCGGTGRL